MVAVLLHNGVQTTELPFSHAMAYFNNREDLMEGDENIVARGVATAFNGDN